MSVLAPYKERYTFKGNTVQDALYFVGDFGEFEAKSQKEFCIAKGLVSSDNFLDLGCGCLRGTAQLVDYLWEGNFHGADVSEGLLEIAPERLRQLGVRKTPILKVMEDFDLRRLFPRPFDFILSVSLLTHILPGDIPALFAGVHDVLALGGVWYFTMLPTDGPVGRGDVNCAIYNKGWLIEQGLAAGLRIDDLPGDYPNPCPNPQNLIQRVNSTLGQWVMKASLL